jgi:hypothetical protein
LEKRIVGVENVVEEEVSLPLGRVWTNTLLFIPKSK